MPQVSINLIHDLKVKAHAPKQKVPFYGLRTGFLRAWVFTVFKVFLIVSVLHGVGFWANFEDNIALLDQYVRKDFSVVDSNLGPITKPNKIPKLAAGIFEPRGPNPNAGVVAGDTTNIESASQTIPSSGKVKGDSTVVINAPSQSTSQNYLTQNYVDDLIRFNIAQAIGARYLVPGTGNAIGGCLQIDSLGVVTTSGVRCRTGGGGGGSTIISGSSSIGGAITGATSGSVLYVDAGGALAQDNANFFYNNATKSLSVGGNLTAAGLGGGGVQCIQTDNAGLLSGTSSACGSGGSSALSDLTAGVASHSIDSTNNDQTWDWSTLTSQNALTLSASGAGLTSGSVLKVSSATTGAVTNGIVQLLATGAYTGSGGLLNVTASGTTSGTVAKITGSALTTGTLLKLSTGNSVITSGRVLDISGTIFAPDDGADAQQVNLYSSNFSSNVTGTSSTTALNIQQNNFASGTGGTQNTFGINLAALGGFPGAGTQNNYGIRIGNYGQSGAENSYGLYVQPQSGATNSYAAVFAGGNVGIGTTAPVAPLSLFTAVTATANYGTLSVGSGVWDGASAGKFVGAAAGTLIAANAPSGSTADLLHLRTNGALGGGIRVNNIGSTTIYDNAGSARFIMDTSSNFLTMNNGGIIQWGSVGTTSSDIGIVRASAGLVEVNDGTTLGNYRDIKFRTGTATTSLVSPLFTNAGALSLTTTASNGNISLTPNGTGSIVLTSGVTTGTTTTSALALSANSLTTGTGLYVASSSLSSGSLLNLAVTGTAGLTNQKGINVSLSGANGTGAQTTYGGYFSNTHTGTSTNIGFYATASGGSNNYAAIFDAGDVAIGTKLPDAPLTISRSGSDASVTFYPSSNTDWQGTYLSVRRSHGTVSSPTDVATGDTLGEFNVFGYANSAYQVAGSTGFYVEGSPVGSNVPTMFNLWLSDSSGPAERLRVTSTGLMGLGTSGPAKQLEINSATGNNLRLTYNDADGSAANYADLLTDSSGNLTITPSGSNVTLTGNTATASADLGNGNAGYVVTLGRNTNATNTGAGSINFQSKAGTAGYVWQDNAGNLRINTSAPTNALDTAGVVVGTQTSTRNTKQDITNYTDYAGALQMVADMPLHTFRYIKDVQGYGTNSPLAKPHIGYIADEVPADFMWGNSIDQVSVNGILLASVKELNDKINILTTQLQNQANNSSLALGQPNLANTPIELASHLYLSSDNVGQAEILAGSTSVRVNFGKPYQYQPIVTATPNSKVGSEFWIADKDSTGFTIYIENESTDDIIFDWHAFAGQAAKLTVSNDTSENIVLVVSNVQQPPVAHSDNPPSENFASPEATPTDPTSPDTTPTDPTPTDDNTVTQTSIDQPNISIAPTAVDGNPTALNN